MSQANQVCVGVAVRCPPTDPQVVSVGSKVQEPGVWEWEGEFIHIVYPRSGARTHDPKVKSHPFY